MRLATLIVSAGLLLAAGSVLGQSAEDRREWPKTDFSRRTVDLAEIESGRPPKDGIPAIDKPRFVPTTSARAWLNPKEPVIVLRLGAETRAYPIQILMFHEILNDVVAGVPVAVTFCPLCNASIVFDRRVGGRTLDFGTTGRLRYSDLVMYDRQTESWWQQFTGKGIVGRYSGAALKSLPSEIIAYEDFEAAHPKGLVLSVSAGGRHRLYPLTLLERNPVANRELAGAQYVVFAKGGMLSPLDRERIAGGRPIPAATAFGRRLDGRVLEFALRDGRYFDSATGSEWNILGEAISGPLKGKRLAPIASGVHFAFAWLAFNPDSEIVRSLP